MELKSLTLNDTKYDRFRAAVDTTLSLGGTAADAKAVGSAFAQVWEGIAGLGTENSHVIAAEQELTFGETYGVQMSDLILAESRVVGSTYKVVWGGAGHVCQCYATVEGGGMTMTGTLLGNANIFLDAMPDTGEPFYIAVQEETVFVAKRAEDATTKIAIYGAEEMASKSYVQRYVEAANVSPASIDLSQYESAGTIVETFADGTTKTTVVEFDANGKPVKITDSAGRITNLTW